MRIHALSAFFNVAIFDDLAVSRAPRHHVKKWRRMPPYGTVRTNFLDLRHELGIDMSHETVSFCWNRFGPIFAAAIREQRVEGMWSSGCRWHRDEVFVKINGEQHYLWRAVEHAREVLECLVTKTRDKKAALKILKKSLKRYGRADKLVTDRLRSYGAVLKELGIRDR
ncbi:DDE-type integrase/transposase/recombinase [Hoeflea sp. G2-23]|uniref:DDE-type integrase/transposase/recombinase n=1 Tax=Hoeflea algicola TaxID=2983763 RepID=A0ABT3ZEW1_9HYPH|nr:DDE-type integrase/transposase/recombinase [Hoeflea algicola]MCY0150196.1 DDE-type integrase/transposase/recombinase [Hoeflea algicola]